MCKLNKANNGTRIDPCMRFLISYLKNIANIEILACCCGHGKYPMTIVVRYPGNKLPLEICSYKFIPRKKKFYKKDKQGVYYIPEITC